MGYTNYDVGLVPGWVNRIRAVHFRPASEFRWEVWYEHPETGGTIYGVGSVLGWVNRTHAAW